MQSSVNWGPQMWSRCYPQNVNTFLEEISTAWWPYSLSGAGPKKVEKHGKLETLGRHWGISWTHFRSSKNICIACWLDDLTITPQCIPLLSDIWFSIYSFKLNDVVDSKVTGCCNNLTNTAHYCVFKMSSWKW